MLHRYETKGTLHLFTIVGFWMFSGEDSHPRLETGKEFICRETAEWCFERFGEPGIAFVGDDAKLVPVKTIGDGRWVITRGGLIIIPAEADALEFRLRWC